MISRYLKKNVKRILDGRLFIQRLPASFADSVLLTFDDGPHPIVTPRILDLLDAHGVLACFFVVGKFVVEAPELLRDIVSRGHAVGNHTYSHDSAGMGVRAYVEDLQKCQEVIRNGAGVEARLFRPPRGRVTVAGTLAARTLGQRQLLWSVEGGEWGFGKDRSAAEIGGRLAADVKGGDIVLLHDNNEKTPVIVEMLLPVLAQKGFDLTSSVCRLTG